MKTRITAIILTLCLMVSVTAYFAPVARAEDEPPVEGQTFQAADYDEFLTAYIKANDGDTIVINGAVTIQAGTYFGGANKSVTMLRGNETAQFVFDHSDVASSTEIAGFVFDGADIAASMPYIAISHNVAFQSCHFINCSGSANGGAVNAANGDISFTDCQFEDNSGYFGGHLFISGTANVSIQGCNLVGGCAQWNGGAINNLAVCSITSSTINGNAADGSGGGIASTGQLTLTESKVYGNTAVEGGADVASGIWGTLTLNDSLETLTSIFDDTGLEPAGWVYDYPSAPITTPVIIEQMDAPQFIPLKMAFEVDDPEPEIVYVEVPVEVEKIVYVEVPVYVSDSSSGTTSTPTPKPEPTKEPEPTKAPVLTCGEAAIDASRRDYLSGYADSHAGQETPLKRAQAAQVIYRLLTDESISQIPDDSNIFSDVPPDHWAHTFIQTLRNAGAVAGCGNGQFQPDRALTQGEMIAMFTRFTEPRTDQAVQLDHWSADAVQTAASLGWIDYGDDFDPNVEVSVQEFIDFALTMLEWANNC